MKAKYSKNQINRAKLEERVKYFINNQSSNNNKHNSFKTSSNSRPKIIATLKDLTMYQESKLENQKPKTKELTNLYSKTKINISSLSTENNDGNNINQNQKKNNQFIVNKEMGKHIMEPRFKIKEFAKISPKFYKSNESSNNLSKIFNHVLTNSEVEMYEIDEKLPQKKMEQIELKRIQISENFPFHFLTEIEKCYQEISKDLKGNGNKNLDYKMKIAATYLSILLDEENPIYNLFLYNKNINQFFIRELCLFLSLLFLKDYNNIQETDILDFNNCVSFCHLNFLYIIYIIVSKTKEENFKIKDNDGKNTIEKGNSSFMHYKKCKTIIEVNEDKIDKKDFDQSFHNNNKIIKSMIFNLLSNLTYLNEKISNNILLIFQLAKTTKIKTVINSNLRTNEIITEKINKIIRESISQENNSSNSSEEEEENLPPPEPPFLPPKKPNDKREYCLVLDLDETLVHFFENEDEAYVKVRMGTETFIKTLSKYCEIVIFTASTRFYADIVINGMDCKDSVDYRLYRQHTTIIDGVNVKDLSKLGRDLNKIIIIDNIEDNYQFQPENGLNISDFEGDENDNELQFLLNDLLHIVMKSGKNVCEELGNVRRNMEKRYTNIS